MPNLPVRSLSSSAQQHLDDHNVIHPAVNNRLGRGVFNVIDYGATGDGTADDTAEVQAAIDAAEALTLTGTSDGRNPIVYFPKGTYKISSTLNIAGSISLMGGWGHNSSRNEKPKIIWAGTAGGTMVSNFASGDRARNLFQSLMFDGGTLGTAANTAMKIGDSGTTSGLDFFCHFQDCHFVDFDGNVLNLDFGPTYFSMESCRFDGIKGYCLLVRVNNSASVVHFSNMYSDLGSTTSATDGAGLIWASNVDQGTNKNLNIQIDGWKVEFGRDLGGRKALIRLDRDGDENVKAYDAYLRGIRCAPSGGFNDYAIVEHQGVTTGPTFGNDDQFYAVLVDCRSTGRYVDGTSDVVPINTARSIPFAVFAPQTFGDSGAGAEASYLQLLTQVWAQALQVGEAANPNHLGSNGRGVLALGNALTNPSTNPTNGVIVYSDGGVMKLRTASGVTWNFTQQTANADTSGATLGQLETEVNELKAALRTVGVIAT